MNLFNAIARQVGALAIAISLLAFAEVHGETPWSFQPLRRPPVPLAKSNEWVRGAIDCFVLDELQRQGLKPSPAADSATFVRRASLALTGLPPTLAELDAFQADVADDAYERLIQRLLASPRYGEHQATIWLDLARYADTHGYHMDAHREMWRWRDGLITALNAGQPYDQFTIEQLAGDLLPDASLEQQIASGFHRNTMVNFEAGAIPAEFLAEYVADRVAVTATVWMGLTLQCCRCHDHKYDPLTQRDFYQLAAFFNRVGEKGIDGDRGNAEPMIAAPSSQQEHALQQLSQQIADVQRQLDANAASCEHRLAAWEKKFSRDAQAASPIPADARGYLTFDQLDQGQVWDAVAQRGCEVTGGGLLAPGKLERALLCTGKTRVRLDGQGSFDQTDAFSISLWLFPTTQDAMTVLARTGPAPQKRGWFVRLEQGRVSCGLSSDVTHNRLEAITTKPLVLRQWQHVAIAYDGTRRAAGLAVYIDGLAQTLETRHDQLDGSLLTQQPLQVGGGDESDRAFRGLLDELRIFSRRLAVPEIARLAGSDPLRDILALAPEQRSDQQRSWLRQQYLQHHDPVHGPLLRALASLEQKRQEQLRRIPTTMVMRDLPASKPTYLLRNGRYDQPGELVQPDTPAQLLPFPADQPRNRLGLARWLVDPRHPLTARVAVNRLWQQAFGRGLVETPEDFGSRGRPPSHPALLDWLACELIDSGWDTKRILALILGSATFRQASGMTDESRTADTTNRWYSRGPIVRLTGESIRDSALAVSGLLVDRLGGPPVFPYQPPGLWEEIAYDASEFTAQAYTASQGADLYRRSIYTFWKRSAPHPALATLGTPNRETCITQRVETETPLEALVLLNEPGRFEAAGALARRSQREGGTSDETRLHFAFRLVTSRHPTKTELEILLAALRDHRHAAEVTRERRLDHEEVGTEAEVGKTLGSQATAEEWAWTMIANTLLCLDEAAVRR